MLMMSRLLIRKPTDVAIQLPEAVEEGQHEQGCLVAPVPVAVVAAAAAGAEDVEGGYLLQQRAGSALGLRLRRSCPVQGWGRLDVLGHPGDGSVVVASSGVVREVAVVDD